jgi:two-component system response regulator RegX3
VLRRIDPNRSVGQKFGIGPWEIDLSVLKACAFGKEVALTPTEGHILQYFAANPNRIISRQELYERVWHDQITDIGTRTMDMHIANLRSKLAIESAEPLPIVTIRGAGYMYKARS